MHIETFSGGKVLSPADLQASTEKAASLAETAVYLPLYIYICFVNFPNAIREAFKANYAAGLLSKATEVRGAL